MLFYVLAICRCSCARIVAGVKLEDNDDDREDKKRVRSQRSDSKKRSHAGSGAHVASKKSKSVDAFSVASVLFGAGFDVRGSQFLDRGARNAIFPGESASSRPTACTSNVSVMLCAAPAPLGVTQPFGEPVDVAVWIARAAKAGASGGGATAAREDVTLIGVNDVAPASGDDAARAGLTAAGRAEAAERALERPMKTVRSSLAANVRAQAALVEFEGRSDGQSVRAIVAALKVGVPLRCVCLLDFFCAATKINSDPGHRGGVGRAGTALRGRVQASAVARHPRVAGRHVRDQRVRQNNLPSSDSRTCFGSYRVQLRESLLESVQLARVGQYGLAYIDAAVEGGGVGSDLALVPAGERFWACVVV